MVDFDTDIIAETTQQPTAVRDLMVDPHRDENGFSFDISDKSNDMFLRFINIGTQSSDLDRCPSRIFSGHIKSDIEFRFNALPSLAISADQTPMLFLGNLYSILCCIVLLFDKSVDGGKDFLDHIFIAFDSDFGVLGLWTGELDDSRELRLIVGSSCVNDQFSNIGTCRAC